MLYLFYELLNDLLCKKLKHKLLGAAFNIVIVIMESFRLAKVIDDKKAEMAFTAKT